ncbi:MAG: carbohydrate porin [Fuerstiella sp.]|nr:carbohydrate porin [Fuerstiella sp.]MCP4855622.1 carbohydrate porin [Fuerstiella sp.]
MLSIRPAIATTFALAVAFCILQLTGEAIAQCGSGDRQGCGETIGFLDRLPCHCDRKTLTGEWWGARSSLEEEGITFDATVTQFYQGVASGGLHQRFGYSGHGDYEMSFDFGKLFDAEGWSLGLGSEHRFGETVNEDTGSVVPVALLPNLPEPETDDLALTKVLFTHRSSDQFKIFFGKIDTLEFDQNGIADGKGRDRFFSTAFIYNPVATRTIPFSTLGAGLAVGEEEDPLFVFAVVNSEDTATTSGFDELFADGAAMFGELRLPTQFFGRSGHQMFGGSWSSRTFTSLNQSQRLEFPDLPIAEKEGSWALFWNANQFIWEDPCDAERGWGLFGRAGISDGNPNPVQWSLSFGIGGSSPISGRRDDSFGIGWYYTGISDEMGPVVSSLFNDGQGVELYYSIAVTKWFYVTPDLQVVEPNAVTAETAIVPGVRVRVDF